MIGRAMIVSTAIVFDPALKRGSALPAMATLRRAARAAQAAVGLVGEVTVLLTDDAGIRRLNRRFRGKNKATDVLSFPAAEAGSGPSFGIAGDLAISVETAARQAAAEGHPLTTELRVLMLHGMLHLAGMDHEADAGEMAAREAELRRRLRLPLGLIERVCAPGQDASEQDASGQDASGQGTRDGKARRSPSRAGKGKSRAGKGKNGSGSSKGGAGVSTVRAVKRKGGAGVSKSAASGRVRTGSNSKVRAGGSKGRVGKNGSRVSRNER